MPEPLPHPLPLADLLAELRDRGLAVGVREHLVVGRLLERWQDCDLAALKTALAALLATNPEEARQVRLAFDRLYVTTAEVQGTPPPPAPWWRRFRAGLRPYWAGLAAALMLVIAIAFLLTRDTPPIQGPEALVTPPESVEAPPPEIDWPEPEPVPNRIRAAAAGGGLALAAFLALYLGRISRQARRRGARLLADDADSLDDPQSYGLRLPGLAPPFSRALLDDLAVLLGRRAAAVEARREIDVDRSLERTLDSGLAPWIVLRRRSSSKPLLIFEDVGPEMRHHRHRVRCLVRGLERRGVHLEHWRFEADAGTLYQRLEAPPATLRRLARQRPESPLLIVSTGQGLLEGDDFRPSAWVEQLDAWLSRAWLHPDPDPATWRGAIGRLPLPAWPMTPGGLMAAARHLASGVADRTPAELRHPAPARPLAPLDVDRLRAMLALAPRRDPELAELLRQRFCPWVPASAVPAALAAPPLEEALPFGPSEEEIRDCLHGVLEGSEPRPGSAAHERWRLDRALQAIHLPARHATGLSELAELGEGPLAAEVEAAVEPVVTGEEAAVEESTRRALRRGVLQKLGRRARGRARAEPGPRPWHGTMPRLADAALPLLLVAAAVIATPYLGAAFNSELRPTELLFDLSFEESGAGDDFRLEVQPRQPFEGEIEIYQDDRPFAVVTGTLEAVGSEKDRGHWYWARAELENGVLGVSPMRWVPGVAAGRLLVTVIDKSTGEPITGLPFLLGGPPELLSLPSGASGTPLSLQPGRYRITMAAATGYIPVDVIPAAVAIAAGETTEITVLVVPRAGAR